MRLPKFIGDRITNYVDEEDSSHRQACHDRGLDPHDIDPINDLPWTLDNCFPQHLEADGLHTYRTIDWGELWDTLWIPSHRGLRLCRVGWHLWGCVYWGEPQRYARCTSCATKREGWLPRWAR